VKTTVAIAVTIAVALGGTSYAEDSASYLGVLNQERASHGVAPLHMSADLVRVAQSWSEEMARTGELRHNPRLESDVANWWAVGENVGVGPDLRDIEQAFWNSAEHRRNILDAAYTDVGIAAAYSEDRVWMTVVFRKPWHRVARPVTHHVVPVVHPQRVSRPSKPKPSPPVLTRVMWFARWRTLR